MIARDGGAVAFSSNAADLVDFDGNETVDAFVRRLDGEGRTHRASVAEGGRELARTSTATDLTADGDSVAFTSAAGDVVPGDGNRRTDAFVGPSFPESLFPETSTSRLAGRERFSTAVSISRHRFPDHAEDVYLARADEFADALAGGSLSGGPVLLVPSCGPPPQVVAGEIERLSPRRVVALGGDAAVCDDLLLRAAAGRETARLEGATRYETAVAIARSQYPRLGARPQDTATPVVYAAVAEPLVDALSAGVLRDGPLLLVPPDGSIPAAVSEAIDQLLAERVVAIGGRAAISDETLDRLADGLPTGRIAGADRTSTAVAVSRTAFPDPDARLRHVYLARDDVAADAVAAGSLRAGPVLPVASCGTLPAPVAEELGRLAPGTVLALGGPAAVCDDVLAAAGTAAALRQCTAEQLEIGLEELGDDGRRATLRLRNTSSRPCQLQGAPQVRFLNTDGGPNPRIETRPSPAAETATPVVLGGGTAAPGEQPTGHVVLQLDADDCRTADLITGIEVATPDGGRVVAPASMGQETFAPCSPVTIDPYRIR